MLSRELTDQLSPLRLLAGLLAALLIVGAYLGLEALRGGARSAVRELPVPRPDPPGSFGEGWQTDFGRAEVSLDEFLDGGVRRGGVPALREPRFQRPEDATGLQPNEPVVVVLWRGDARAYPVRLLVWHQVVNDVVGGQPVAVVYSPFLAASATWDRVQESGTVSFGLTGRLRRGDVVLFDEGTESWWQGLQGRALVGDLTGEALVAMPSWLMSWRDFLSSFPEGLVVAPDAASGLPYGHNPYSEVGRLAHFRGPEPPADLPAEARVLGFTLGEAVVAYPLSTLSELGVVNTQVARTPVAIFHQPGPADPLASPSFAEGPPLDVAYVYQRQVGDRLLAFTSAGGILVDKETGSRWNVLGRAVEGPLAGEQLRLIPHLNVPWAYWASVHPDTELARPGF